MVTQYGMSDKLGPMTLGEPPHEVFLGRDFGATPDYSQEIAFEIDKEVRRLIDGGFERAKAILTERRAQLDLMASVLIERETIAKDEIQALLEDRWDEYVANEPAEEPAEEPAAAGSGEEKPKRSRRKKSEDADAPSGGEVPPTAEPVTGM